MLRQDVTDLAEERHEFPISLLLSALPRALGAGDSGASGPGPGAQGAGGQRAGVLTAGGPAPAGRQVLDRHLPEIAALIDPRVRY